MSTEPIQPLFRATEEILRVLEKSKRESELAMDRFPGIFLIVDSAGKILRSNDDFLRMVPKSTPGSSIIEILDAENGQQLAGVMLAAAQNLGKTYDLELNLKDRSLELALSLYAWKVEAGSFAQKVFFSLLGRDLTQLKAAMRVNHALQREITAAEQVQMIMLPQKTFENEFFKLSCEYRAASECGGDFLHYQVLPDKLRIWSGDVTGHGVGPAMIAGAMRAAVSMIEQDSLISVNAALVKLNQCIFDIAKGNYWMSFQIAEFDFKNQTMEVAQAGHTPVYCLNLAGEASHNSWRDVASIGSDPSHQLGIENVPSFGLYKLAIAPNSTYLSFSDGLIEASNEHGKTFGIRRILEHFDSPQARADELSVTIVNLFAALSKFNDRAPLQDDVSIWTLRCKKR